MKLISISEEYICSYGIFLAGPYCLYGKVLTDLPGIRISLHLNCTATIGLSTPLKPYAEIKGAGRINLISYLLESTNSPPRILVTKS